MTLRISRYLDLVLLWVAMSLSMPVSGHWFAHSFPGPYWVVVAATLVWIVASTSLRLYEPSTNRDLLDDATIVTVVVMAVTTILACVDLFASHDVVTPKAAPFVLILWPVVLGLRLLGVRPGLKRGPEPGETLIVGTGALGMHTADDLRRIPQLRSGLGFLGLPADAARDNLGSPYLGTSDALGQCLLTHVVSEVYVAGNAQSDGPAMQAVIKTCETFGVPFALPAHSFLFDRACPADWHGTADGYTHYLNNRATPHQQAVKRMFDVAAAGVAMLLLLPLFLLVAALIKLTTKGPVFFRQVRVGLHGRTFQMIKFRSMVIDAEEQKSALAAVNEQAGPVFKMKRDPRVTRVGRFIRKYSIDELPQLINVLRADMSIVGPRPAVPTEVRLYEPWQRRRFSVRPGLTCIWQVSGRGAISFKEWMNMDMQYIDQWSLQKDFHLILKTIPVVLSGRGAS